MQDEYQNEVSSKIGKLGGNLAGLSLRRQIFKIASWPFIEQVLSFFAAASGLMIAGRIGEGIVTTHITNGMGAVSYIAWMGFVLQGAVATGGTALVSRLTGARQYKEANFAAMQTMLLGVLAGVASCILMLVFTEPLLTHVLKMKGESAFYAREYMGIMSYTALFSGIVFGTNGALRGSGDTRTPFLIMAVVDVVGIVLSCLFVWGPGELGGHGVRGIALGSFGSFVVGCVILIFVLHRRRKKLFGHSECSDERLNLIFREKGADYAPPVFLDYRKLRFDWSMIWRVTRIGGPNAIEIFLVWAIQFYSLSIVASLPEEGAVGAHTIVLRTESMSFMPGFAIGTSAATLVGQYLGAGNAEAARQVIRKCAKYAIFFMGTFGVLFFLFPRTFVSIFAAKSVELADMAAPALQVTAVIEVFFAAAIVLKMSLRGAGDVRRVMLISLASIAFFRVGVLTAWAEYSPETMTLAGIWMIFGIDLLAQVLIFWKIFRGDKWSRYKV